MFKLLLLKNYSAEVNNQSALYCYIFFFSLQLSHSDNTVSLNNRGDLDEVNLQFQHKTLKGQIH